MTPEAAMRRALREARRASGRVFPNPAVGAVVYRGDRVLGNGYTRPPGGLHAEVVAIRSALRRFGRGAVRGASLAVTLEPCSHQGRTPPCANLLVEHRLKRVFVGCRDPHPEVSGRGLRRLRRAGIEVVTGVLRDACETQHRGFFSLVARGRPWVTLKLASTLDGRIATRSGESRWITGPEAQAVVHAMRARSDAVAVGSKTVLADDPALTARRGDRVVHRPQRVLVDSQLRVPVSAKLYCDHGALTRVLCGTTAPTRRRRAVAATGATLLELPLREGHIPLRPALRRLGREGLTELLVEGGGELAAALLRARLVDEVHWFGAPILIGSDGRASLGELSIGRLGRAPRLVDVQIRRLGDDVHVWGPVAAPPPVKRRAQP